MLSLLTTPSWSCFTGWRSPPHRPGRLLMAMQERPLAQGARYDSVAGQWPQTAPPLPAKPKPTTRTVRRKAAATPRDRRPPSGGSASENLALVLKDMEPMANAAERRAVGRVLQGRRLRPRDYTTVLKELRRAGKQVTLPRATAPAYASCKEVLAAFKKCRSVEAMRTTAIDYYNEHLADRFP